MTKYQRLIESKEKIKAAILRSNGMWETWKGKLNEIDNQLENMTINEAAEIVK